MKTKGIFQTFAIILLAGFSCTILFDGCKKEKNTAVNFTLDLSNSNYSSLNTPGTYLYYDNVLVIRYNTSTFAALEEYCTKDNYTVAYNPTIGFIVCSGCGSRYNIDGTVAFGGAPKPLTKYKTNLSGSLLTVSQ